MRYERKEETRDTLCAWISTVRLGGASEEAGPAASLAIGFPVRTGYRLVSIKLLARFTFFFLPLAEVKKFRLDKKRSRRRLCNRVELDGRGTSRELCPKEKRPLFRIYRAAGISSGVFRVFFGSSNSGHTSICFFPSALSYLMSACRWELHM